MSENITETFSKGFNDLMKNTVLFVPMVVSVAIASLLSLVLDIATVVKPEYFEFNANVLLILTALVTLFAMLISIYFSAGFLGMIKEAVTTGKTSWSVFKSLAQKYFFPLFLYNILYGIVISAGLVLFIPAYLSFTNAGYTFEIFENILLDTDLMIQVFETLAVPLVLGALVYTVYFLVISILFYFSIYSIVVDEISVTAAIQRSVQFLREKPGKVLGFIVCIFLFQMAVIIVTQFIATIVFLPISAVFLLLTINSPESILMGVAFVFVSFVISLTVAVAVSLFNTLFVVWVMRFYMANTEQPLFQ